MMTFQWLSVMFMIKRLYKPIDTSGKGGSCGWLPTRRTISGPNIEFDRKYTQELLSACHVLSVAMINYADTTWLAVAQYNKFENLDRPWVPSDTIRQLHTWWEKHEEKLQSWHQDALDQVLESGS
jgi:hypothetical protein